MTTAFLASCILSYLVLRSLRRKNYSPRLLPGKYLKRKWNQWTPWIPYSQVSGGSPSDRNEDTAYHGAAGGGSGPTVNYIRRETSVRSVITLPAYSAEPKPTEQTIAREGERGGMDVVIEFPETAEEEEARREAEMEALYQIRLQRRREIAEREARRRERQEARARGDLLRLEELRQESRANNNNNLTSAMMLAEHRARGRQRRVASVNYADLGEVRHDGSRIRASSADSDQRPLLGSAASMGADGNGRNSLSSTRANTTTRSRGNSASSVLSASTTPPYEQEEGDVGALQMPPPDYEELDWGPAPPYESPVRERGEGPPQLPEIPRIQIDVATPSNTGTPNTPATPILREQQQSASGGGETQQSSSQGSQLDVHGARSD